MIDLGQGLTVYGPDGVSIVQFPIVPDCVSRFQLMTEDYVKVTFKSDVHIPIGVGSYLTWETRKFIITKDQLPTNEGGSWKYELKFDAEYMIAGNIPFIFDGQIAWSLTANPSAFLELFIEALNEFIGTTHWVIGTVEPTEAITVSFNGTMALSGLTSVAEQCKSEWWFDGYTLNLSKCEHGVAVDMSADDHLSKIEISDSDLGENFNRLFAYGAARNIPADYRSSENTGTQAAEYQKRLRLPIGTPYIDAVQGLDPSEIIVGIKTFDTVYPRKICTVDNLKVSAELTDANGVKYRRYFVHQSDINWSDNYLTTETLSLTFQTGKLAGRTFELNTNPPNLDNQEWIDLQYQAWKEAAYSAWCVVHGRQQDAQSLIDWRVFISEANCRTNYDNFAGNAVLAWTSLLDPFALAQNPAVTPYWIVCVGNTTDFYEYCDSSRDSYVSYHNSWFELINVFNSFYTPSPVLNPVVNDTFVLFNYDIELVSDQFIPDAENELLQVAQDYMAESFRKRKSYSCPTNKVWCEDNQKDYTVGQRVHLYDERLNGYVASRIYSYEKKLVNKFDCTYVVADTSTYNRLTDIEQKVDELQYSMFNDSRLFNANIIKLINDVYYKYLSKADPDTAAKLIKFIEGIETGSFETGITGAKISADGSSEFKTALIRELATLLKGLKVGDYQEGVSGAIIDEQGNQEVSSVKSRKCIEVGEFVPGESGGSISMVDGESVAEVDVLKVRKRAEFRELVIEKLSHIGGKTIQSPASMVCNKVEVFDTYYRCFFDQGDNGETVNTFEALDQAQCQVFTGSALKYYWRLVVAVGIDYIDLSIADCDAGSDIPAIGDNIVQLGHRTNTDRQNAIIQSSIGEPSYKQYAGIHTYSLTGCEQTVLAASGNKIVGQLSIKSGNRIVRVPCDREAWVLGMECNYYDRVSHLGALWLCIIPDGTTTIEEPSLTSQAWQKQVSEGEDGTSPLQVTVLSSRGNLFYNGLIDTVFTAKVYRGDVEITDKLNQNCFRWTRKSDDTDGDTSWNLLHASFGSNVLSITSEDVSVRAVFNVNVTIDY